MTDELPNDPRHVAKLAVIDEALMLGAARREVRQGDKDAERGKRRAQEIADAAEAKELILSFQSAKRRRPLRRRGVRTGAQR